MDLEEALAAALAQVASLTAQLEVVLAERAELRARLDELLAQLNTLLARKTAKRGKTAPEPAPAFPDPAATPAPGAAPTPAPPAAPDLTGRPKPPSRPEPEEPPAGPKPRTPKPPARLPTIEDPPVRPDVCGRCGGSRLSNKDTTETPFTDYVRGYVRRRVVPRIRCRCADCGANTLPAAPIACLPRTHFTADFVAFLLYSKLVLHLPWERIRADLRQQGFDLASSTLNSLVQRALGLFTRVANALWDQLMIASYLHSDATGLDVVTPTQEHVHHGQIFFFGWGKRAVFRYRADKEGPTFKQMVGTFQGTLILDASSTHNAALELPGVVEAGCNAHGLRKFRDAIEADPVLATEGERWIAAMFDKDREGRDKGLTGDALLAWRQAEIAPLAADFKRWIALVHPTTDPKTPLREATNYYANHWRPLTRFLRDPNLPMENNFAERGLRGLAVGRSNWIYAGNAQAARHLAAGFSVVYTAQLEGVDVLPYLSWALTRLVACGDDRALAARLTPAAYKEAQKARDG